MPAVPEQTPAQVVDSDMRIAGSRTSLRILAVCVGRLLLPCTGGIYVALLTARAAASSIAALLVGRHDVFRHLPALESHGDMSTAADTTGNREHIAVGRSSLERQGKYKQQYDREYRGAHPTSFSEISTKIMSFTGGGSKASRGNIMKPTNAVKAN